MAELSPAVTVMIQFSVPNPQHVAYTNRKEAVRNDLDQIQGDIDQASLAQIQAEVPELAKGFSRYVNYTNRVIATQNDSQNLTTMFTAEENNAPQEKLIEVKEKLKVAQENHSLMWQCVTSFDTNFLKEQGLIDPVTQKVNQVAIKEVIREAIPELLEREGLSPDRFWWGNVHLNTKHVHVHVGISELNSQRAVYSKDSNGQIEFKGKFKQKSIKAYKSKVYHSLLRQRDRRLLINQTAYIDFLKKEVVKKISSPVNKVQDQQVFLLGQVYRNLPTNKRLWRYKSNAQDFQVSKFFLDKYLDNYLAASQDYQLFVEESKDYLANYQQVYTKSVTPLAEAFDKRRLELRSRLGNKLLKELKVYDKQQASKAQKQRLRLPNVNDLVQLDSKDLGQVIDLLKQRVNVNSQLLGRYRYALRQRNLLDKQTSLEAQNLRLTQIKALATDKPFVSLKQAENRNLRALVAYQLKPAYQLNEADKKAKKDLLKKYADPSKVSLKTVNKSFFDVQAQRITEEFKAAQAVQDESVFTIFGIPNKETYLLKLKQQLAILNIKRQVNQNNKVLTSTTSEVEKSKLKRDNAKMLRDLQERLQVYRATDLKSAQQRSKLKLENEQKKATTREEFKPIQVANPPRANYTPVRPHLGLRFTQGLNKIIKRAEQEELHALRMKLQDDAQIEYEEQQERWRYSR